MNAKGNVNNVNILCTEMHIKNQAEPLNDSSPSIGTVSIFSCFPIRQFDCIKVKKSVILTK